MTASHRTFGGQLKPLGQEVEEGRKLFAGVRRGRALAINGERDVDGIGQDYGVVRRSSLNHGILDAHAFARDRLDAQKQEQVDLDDQPIDQLKILDSVLRRVLYGSFHDRNDVVNGLCRALLEPGGVEEGTAHRSKAPPLRT